MTIGTPDGMSYECEMRYLLGIPSFADKDAKNLSPSESEDNGNRQIYYVRHGDTDLNEESGEHSSEQPVRGWSSVSLNDDGRKEAAKAAESVKSLGITHIVSSDLPRAKETANIIGNKIGITPEFEPGLRTWDLGDLTEKSGKEVHDQVNHYCKEALDERPPGSSESFNEFKDRILSTTSKILQNHPEDHKILVVSHNSPERVIHSWIEAGQPTKRQRLANAQ